MRDAHWLKGGIEQIGVKQLVYVSKCSLCMGWMPPLQQAGMELCIEKMYLGSDTKCHLNVFCAFSWAIQDGIEQMWGLSTSFYNLIGDAPQQCCEWLDCAI